MRRLTLFGLLAAIYAHGQAHRDLLLPKERTIAGVVVDANGHSVSGASIDHSGNSPRVVTDAAGEFSIRTRAPAIVIRKAGYRSRFLHSEKIFDVQVTLSADTPAPWHTCSATASCESIAGFQALFCFPKVAGVQASPQSQSDGFGARAYAVETPKGRVEVSYGSGAVWSPGIPMDEDVWKSVEYTEAVYTWGRLLILDAHGSALKHKRWRYLGRFGESASYRDADEDAAGLLDRFLDGMCIRPASQ